MSGLPFDPIIIAVVAVVVILIGILASGYVKAPADKAYIISGLKKVPKVLIGRAGIKIPFLERKDELLLKQIGIDIKTGGYVPTKDFIGVDIDAIAKIRLISMQDVGKEKTYTRTIVDEIVDGSNTKDGDKEYSTHTETVTIKITEDMARAAMRNFLNMKESNIVEALQDSLQGNMREIVGTQTLRALCQDRKSFGDEVQSKAQPDMNALGVWIESCNIQRIEDEQDLINALGMDNMAAIQKSASIAKAEADKDVAIAQAKAAREANDAKVAADTEIAEKQNELAIKKAELQQLSDTKKAIADAAYKIQEQEQRKAIETAKVNADIAEQERTVELREKEAQVAEQTLNATVKKQADADKYSRQLAAEANLIEKSRQADAEKYQQEKEAEIQKIKAEADKEAKKKEAEGILAIKRSEAEGIAAVGKAEAQAIEAKGIAEAQAMEKKAEAYSKYNKAAVAEMTIKMLPELAAKVAEPLGQIDKITIIGGGDGSNGIEQVAGNVPVVMAKVFESVKEATGIDLTSIVNAESYDAKVNRNVNLTGIKDTVAISGGSKSDTDADKTENSGIDSDLSGENAEVIRSLAENANQESADSNLD